MRQNYAELPFLWMYGHWERNLSDAFLLKFLEEKEYKMYCDLQELEKKEFLEEIYKDYYSIYLCFEARGRNWEGSCE